MKRGSTNRTVPSRVKGTQRLLRYPFLTIIFAIILLELLVYFILRLAVKLYEIFSEFFKHQTKRRLAKDLGKTETYPQYVQLAKKLDEIEGRNKWKETDTSACYDEQLVKHILGNLRTYKNNKDYKSLGEALTEVFNHVFDWFEDESLYNECYWGTKNLIEEFIQCVHECLVLLRDNKDVPQEVKLELFARLLHEFGQTALCLSGGATLTFYQFGVIQALLEADMIPKIISGTSGGSLVGAGVAVRTDEELKKYLNPHYLETIIKPTEESFWVKLKRLIKTGYCFDWDHWRQRLYVVTNGNTTFLEAYHKTGRVFNVTSISDNHRPILLNYKTTPNVVIWSAVIASSSLPLMMKPSPLIEKLPNGELKQFVRFGKCWADGSTQMDLPTQRLLESFNVKFTICVQCNPHVFNFYYNTRGTPNIPIRHWGRSGMRGGFLSSFLEKFLKLEMRKWMRLLGELDLLPQVFGTDWRYTALQTSRGTVTIHPAPPLEDYFKIFNDPHIGRWQRFFSVGRKLVYPKMCMLQHRLKIQKLIKDAIDRLEHDMKAQGILSEKVHLSEPQQHTSLDWTLTDKLAHATNDSKMANAKKNCNKDILLEKLKQRAETSDRRMSV